MNPRIAQHATILFLIAVSTACSSGLPLDRTTPPGQNGIQPGLIASLLGGAPGFETRSRAATAIMPQRLYSWIARPMPRRVNSCTFQIKRPTLWTSTAIRPTS